MAERLIDAEALYKSIQLVEVYRKGSVYGEDYADGACEAISECLKRIDSALTVETVEVRHAKWLKDRNTIKCSHCGFGMFRAGYYFKRGECFSANDGKFTPSYCPDCGFLMDGEKNESE